MNNYAQNAAEGGRKLHQTCRFSLIAPPALSAFTNSAGGGGSGRGRQFSAANAHAHVTHVHYPNQCSVTQHKKGREIYPLAIFPVQTRRCDDVGANAALSRRLSRSMYK